MSQPQTDFDPLVDEAPSRYVVGIDLGTTNSAVTFVDTQQAEWRVQLFELPQLVAVGSIESRDTLPSFHFQTLASETQAGSLRLPWQNEDLDWCVGTLARDEGVKLPGRLCASAKSWLCHSGVDREAKLLPWHAAADVERLSPVEVSARLLAHVREAWNHAFSNCPLEEQDVVITLPASFDEVARELTVQAAAQAGLASVVLIEEPQAAFYAWVHKHDQDWFQRVEAGHTILVCDIGGGTSDFTLIQVKQNAETAPADATRGGHSVQFHRVAVGDHLILGGDNLDLTLARHIEQKISGGAKLESHQWEVLVRSCRRVKETLLGDNPPESTSVHLPGSGSRLIGGGLQAEVTRQEVEELLLQGFLPQCELTDRPQQGRSGFREFGLPFASDAGMTRHLAAFLSAHPGDSGAPAQAARPDVVLFNGGFFASQLLRERLLQVLSSWFEGADADDYCPLVLDNDRLDLAVARGAAYYGMVRRGEGVRIAANLARSYYVEVESDQPTGSAVCLVPGDAQPGQDIHLDSLPLELLLSQPVEFSLFVSSTRLTDRPGQIVPINREEMRPLPPIRTVVRTERRNQTGTLPVTLHAHLSEIGTIDLWCQAENSAHRWRLQFDVRSAVQTDIEAHASAAEAEGFVDEQTWESCADIVRSVFGDGGDCKPSALVKQLSKTLGSGRYDWPASLLRRIWEQLLQLRAGRKRSPAHEARWLNLVGFCLRPGYGFAVDDWRVAETWRHVHNKLAFAANQSESLILWRRVAGGLTAGQQAAIAQPMLASLRATHAILIDGRQSRGEPTFPMHESEEAWRLLGSLEHLDVAVKEHVGRLLVDLIPKRRFQRVRGAMVWCLGRLGQRQPLYGPLNGLVPREVAANWCEALMELDDEASLQPAKQLALMQLARKTDDRYRDVDDSIRGQVLRWLQETAALERYQELVTKAGRLAAEEQATVFGEALPKGFRISG